MCKHFVPDKPCKRGHRLRFKSNGACVECESQRMQKPSVKAYQQNYRKSLEGKYVRHRNHAIERNVGFNLSYKEWLTIWEDSGMIDSMGNKRGSYVMSRKGDVGAYEVGNVFIQSFSDNIAERNKTVVSKYGE